MERREAASEESGRTAPWEGARAGRGFGFTLFIFLLLAMGAPSVHSAGLIDGTIACSAGTVNLLGTFNSPIYAIIAFTCALVGLVYMIGTAYSKPEWTIWARSEAVTLAWSVVLVGVILGAFSSSCMLSNLMLGGQGLASTASVSPFTTPAGMASVEMGRMLNQYGPAVAEEMVQSSIQDQMGSLKYAYWSVPVWDGGGLAYTANMRAWSAHKELLVDLYLPLMTSIMAQKMMIEVLMPGVFGVLLPAAIMLRMLFLTRDVGNLLLALAFALYFALPLTYVFFMQATAQVEANVLKGSLEKPFGDLQLGYDDIVGDSMQRIGFLATQAILIPNLAIVIVATMTMALHKAFRGMVA